MLPYLSALLETFWGPFRLLSSYMVLICTGAMLGALLTWFLLPRLWHRLPQDRGKVFVQGSQQAKGKPTGAGLFLVIFFTVSVLLIAPPSLRVYGLTGSLLFCMLCGYLDDRSPVPWGQLKKGLLDLLAAGSAACFLTGMQAVKIWLPFFKGALPGGAFLIPAWYAILGTTALLWFCINAVNCSDGVDGLAGSLSFLALFFLGAFLYGIAGNAVFARYLLVPFYPNAAPLSLLFFTAAGVLCGYLWYNANPSMVLMGDAGSRFLGMLIGIGAIGSGNPFLLLVVAPILLFNGGAGLVKLVFLRCLKKMGYDVRQPLSNVPNPEHPENFATDAEAARQLKIVRFAHKIRFPLHDQCRKNWGWSGTQVLVRFMLLQAVLAPLLIVLFLKIR